MDLHSCHSPNIQDENGIFENSWSYFGVKMQMESLLAQTQVFLQVCEAISLKRH